MYFGTDPEYLIVNKLGRPIPAHKAGFGDKEHKMILRTAPYGGPKEWESRAFRDGYMVEINIKPDRCRQIVTYRMRRAVVAVQHKLPAGYRLAAIPAVRINLEQDMKNAPEDVKQFGCKPSYDAYELEAKIPPIDAMTHPLRYAGGHLHFGYSGENSLGWMKDKEQHPKFVKMMDLYVGLPLTYLFDSKQTFQRRRFYGQAGEFRSQKYGKGTTQIGVEYRTPGPEVWNSPWVASFAMGAGRYIGMNLKKVWKRWDKGIEADLVAAINTGEGVEKLLKLAVLPGYHEYPATFLALKKYVPKTLALARAAHATVAGGFYDWSAKHNIKVTGWDEPRYGYGKDD